MYDVIKTNGLPGQLREQADRVRDIVEIVIEGLIESASEYSTAKSLGLGVSKRDCKRWVADIETPVGSGRLVLDWRIISRELMGVLSVQRKQYDQYDRVLWAEVWAVNVPAYGDPYVGQGQGEGGFSIPLDDDYPMSNGKYAIGRLGVFIVEAIASGPVPRLSPN